MSKTTEAERDALRQAAEASAVILEQLEREQSKLSERIASLRAVVQAWEFLSGKRTQKSSYRVVSTELTQLPLRETLQATQTRRARKGKVMEHVDAILCSGGEFEERELRRQIEQRFGVSYGRPSIYSALVRGKKEGKYEQFGRIWKEKEQNHSKQTQIETEPPPRQAAV